MRISSFVFMLMFFVATGQVHAADLIKKKSENSVAVTVDKLVAAAENAGAKVFARVDHAAGAASVGMKLRPTQMIMFGNPKLGTPALLLSQSAGLDLPLRVVVFEDETGTVYAAYHSPTQLAGDHGIPADADILKKMAGALGKLTNKATVK